MLQQHGDPNAHREQLQVETEAETLIGWCLIALVPCMMRMIATLFAIFLGGFITVLTLICFAYLLAHLQDSDRD